MSIKIHKQTNVAESFGVAAAVAAIVIFPCLLVPVQHLSATTLPAGFAEEQYATGLTNPTAMAFAPDLCPASGTPVHRLFICEQAGRVRVFRNGVLKPQPFLTVSVDSCGERGLDGICFDPNFATNHYVYVYYTVPETATAPPHNRLSRFTADPANPDVALAGSETRIMEMDDLGAACIHNGSALRFGPDGKLYVSTGDPDSLHSQSLSTVLGKILRINPVPENADGTNPDATFPADNPFYNTTTGKNRAIYVLGLRNPFTFNFQPGTGRMFIDDVGGYLWEEINEGISGRNYGWPTCEGTCQPPVSGMTNPLLAYQHNPNFTPYGCAITGGAFYNPSQPCSGDPPYRFPNSYVGQYFFMDFCQGWIYTMDPNQIDPASPYGYHKISPFASDIHGYPTYLTVGPDRNLYYISRTDGAVYQIHYPASLGPTISTQPEDVLVGQGWPATFTVAVTGVQPLHYRWQRNNVDIAGAADSPSYTLQHPTVAADNGAMYRCVISNSYGSAATRQAVLSVTTKQPPVCTISSPPLNAYYEAGDRITFAGSAVDGHDIVTHDPQDGVLGPNAFTWQVLFEHHSLNNPNHHTHPFYPPTSGIAGGSFTIPLVGETDPDVWFRIFFTARDSYGLSTTIVRDIFPRHVQLNLTTAPALFPVKLDGAPKATPYSFWTVAHLIRNIGVETPQIINGLFYDFVSWSDQGGRLHNIAPRADSAYVANFWKRPGYGSITANPNPVQVTGGSGRGATTLLWSSRQTNHVEVHRDSPTGGLVAQSGAGSFSYMTNKVITDGTTFYLQDVSNNQPLSSDYTLDSVTLHLTAAPTGSITANPNPLPTFPSETTVAWTSYGTSSVEIHVDAPNGNAFTGSGPGSFSARTGMWAKPGMTLYLQNVSNGLPLTAANTLATVTLIGGTISISPSPIHVSDGTGLGIATVTWSSGGTKFVEVHINAPDGPGFSGGPPGTFRANTGKWVRNGMKVYLQDVSDGKPLTSANTLAVATATVVSP